MTNLKICFSWSNVKEILNSHSVFALALSFHRHIHTHTDIHTHTYIHLDTQLCLFSHCRCDSKAMVFPVWSEEP